MSDPTEVDSLNYLGIDFDDYRSRVYSYALAYPADYLSMREIVVTTVRNEAVKNLYRTFRNAMMTGTTDGSTPICKKPKHVELFKPKMPKHLVETFCLSAAQTLRRICEECVNELLPRDADEVMKKKFADLGALPSGEPSTT